MRMYDIILISVTAFDSMLLAFNVRANAAGNVYMLLHITTAI